MKKFLLGTAIVISLALVLGYLFRDAIGYWVAGQMMSPKTDFDPAASPATGPDAPDYTKPQAWSALPSTVDGADTLAGSFTDNQASATADVFFIHPTTYLSPDAWNAPLDDAAANDLIDNSVNVAQASAFNGCCRIFAPRYRQATFAAFFPAAQAGGEAGNGAQAMNLAYSDLIRAFDEFLTTHNNNRPFILAGHSQGSMHLKRLLTERISGTPLLSRLVAVYAVGAIYPKAEVAEEFFDLPVCGSATQTQCLITWNTVGPNVSHFRDASDDVCVNPLTWDAADATHEDNLGAFVTASKTLLPGVADASCVDGQLMVSELRSEAFANLPMNMGTDNYHILDYSLFYASIRANAMDRVAAFNQQP